MRKGNVIRIAVVLSIFAVFVGFVLRLQRDIKADLAMITVSVTNEYKAFGKPVSVSEITQGDVDVYSKATIIPTKTGSFLSFITKDVKDELSVGQALYVEENQIKSFGEIVFISNDIDVDSGLYRIECEFINRDADDIGRKIARIYDKTLTNVIFVPNNIVEIDGEKRFVWIVRDGRAKKTEVTIGEQVFGDVIIVDGLNVGDVVVVAGNTMLKENDKVRIINEEKGVRS